MIIIKTIKDLTNVLTEVRDQNHRIGFIPTMGALHGGHISLIKKSVDRNNFTVCSIFVNPTQFNDKNDFEKYPVTINADTNLLKENDCDLLFLPSVEEIYPEGMESAAKYELGFIETILEGRFRPGHFQGVCQVVERLLRIVKPHELFLGQKDLQQIIVLKKMIELKNLDVTIVIGETLREKSGLAASSRNARLSQEQRYQAGIIYKMLLFSKEHLHDMDFETINAYAQRNILEAGFEKIDYFSFHDAETLQPVELWDGQQKIAALFAGYIGGVRLIDNMFLN